MGGEKGGRKRRGGEGGGGAQALGERGAASLNERVRAADGGQRKLELVGK